MKAETADYLAKARATLADAEKIAAIPLAHVAAREAYYARRFTRPRPIFLNYRAKRRARIEAYELNSRGCRVVNRGSTVNSGVFWQQPISLNKRPITASARLLHQSPRIRRRQPSPPLLASSIP
jgi:hypothetical protein